MRDGVKREPPWPAQLIVSNRTSCLRRGPGSLSHSSARWARWSASDISQPLHEPEPGIPWRIALHTAEFAIPVVAIKIRRLKTCGVEAYSNATPRSRDFFRLD